MIYTDSVSASRFSDGTWTASDSRYQQDESVKDPKLIQRRIEGIEKWLAEQPLDVKREQRHLNAGTPEQAYWHFGYMMALKDVIRRSDSRAEPRGKCCGLAPNHALCGDCPHRQLVTSTNRNRS